MSGFLPQIITQALFHFNVDKKLRIDEVVIISTTTGLDTYYNGYDARNTPIFLGDNGKFSDFFHEYNLPQPTLKTHKIADSAGHLIGQLTSQQDFDAAAFTILNKLKRISVEDK